MTTLHRPDERRYDEWAAIVREYGIRPEGSGLPDPPETDRAAFTSSLVHARAAADTSVPAPEGRVHEDLYWIVDDGELLVGFLSLRHGLTDFLREVGGHIGYSVRPSRRREGHAHRALGLALARAHEICIDRVLVTCDEDNIGSYKTIESQGGALEDVRHGKRRYWIAL